MMQPKIVSTILLLFIFSGCSNTQPEQLVINKDQCTFCKMTVADAKYGAEAISNKGRIYKFDDINCMFSFKQTNENIIMEQFFVADYSVNNQLIDATKALYVTHETIKSPMGSNTAAFSQKSAAESVAKAASVQVVSWENINQ